MNHCYTVSLSVYLRSTRLSKLCSRWNMSFVAGTTTKAIVSTLAGDYVCLATDFVNTTASLCICARCNYRDRCVVEIKMKGKFDECFPKTHLIHGWCDPIAAWSLVKCVVIWFDFVFVWLFLFYGNHYVELWKKKKDLFCFFSCCIESTVPFFYKSFAEVN